MGKNKHTNYPLRLEPSFKTHLMTVAKKKGIPLSVLILECLQSQMPDSTSENHQPEKQK